MCCPPNRNGNMPAVRVRPRRTHGVIQLPVRMRTGIMVRTLTKRWMSDNFPPTHGAFLICTEMCGSGPRTGTRRLIPPATRWWILADRHRARIGSSGWFLEQRRDALRSARRYTAPPATVTATRLPCWFPTAVARGEKKRSSMGVLFP